jgi:hypothetical protein
MRWLRRLLVPLLLIGLAITSIGWVLSARHPNREGFTSCARDSGSATVTYDYGANERVAVVLDSRDGKTVMSLETNQGSGDTPDIGLSGQASFAVFGEPTELEYPDGRSIDCEGF